MANRDTRAYSRYTQEAVELLSKSIRSARIEQEITTQELSNRADISRGLLNRIENADPACSIGIVFEVASILGLQLFQSSLKDLRLKNKEVEEKLALLPSRVRKPLIEVDDDF